MLKKTVFLLMYCSAPFLMLAQKSLSYVNDRKFNDPTDLLGYNFRPTMLEIKDVKKQNLVPGSVAFGITENNLYVEGEGFAGVYSVNNINSTEFGYKLLLMNARDPTLQGHLKIILNKKREVEALVFLRSNKDKETIFYIANIPADLAKKESAYFTDRGERTIFHADSLWGKTIRPFMTIHSQNNIQERIQMRDSASIKFVEKITIIDKTKKKDKAAKDSVSTAGKAPVPSKPDDKKNIKIIKEHFAIIRAVLKYEDGTEEDKTIEYTIKNYSLKEDKNISYEGDRYLLNVETNKGDMNIFLNGDKAVNSIVFDGKTYYVRGF